MKYFCINIKGATARREHCEQVFKAAGIDVTFIRGFNARQSGLKHEQDWITCQVGACISHYMAVEEIHHNNLGVSVVFEDDITISHDFYERLDRVLYTLPENWDVAALCYFAGSKGATFDSVNEHWQKFTNGDVWGQAAYLVNGAKGAEKILDCITPIRSHIDRMFWECCRDGLMNGYFIKQQFVNQGWNFPSQNI